MWEGLAAVNGGRRADAVIVTPADTGAMAAGVDAAGPDATVVLFSPAPPGAALSLDPHRLYFDEVSIVPSYSCGPEETRQALAFLQAGVVRAADLVERCYPLDEAPQAYRDVASGRVLKALVVSGSGDPAPGWKSGHDDG
ncbi:MAG: hypothetical protein IRY95_02710 [Clostridia bacterium]|nr:hypothetical protein [Clostridia bacterium]